MMYLRLDSDVQKYEVEKLRKGKRKVEEDLDNLKTEYKKLHTSIRNASLGKTSEQWCQEIQEERDKADQWEMRLCDTRVREDALKKTLFDSRSENEKLRARIAELEKGKVEELESALQSREL
ncbi:hypothetical protein J1N35_015568 [Gossypium stocksii]|uniref:Uncharacterized protein n=1 Tax=Gossypium stocksii TaxID=47602 RepID=A0A9D4AAY9_9ROSI|nr:hypothetical protein J1N35_015568 [Gossypium stocksii]